MNSDDPQNSRKILLKEAVEEWKNAEEDYKFAIKALISKEILKISDEIAKNPSNNDLWKKYYIYKAAHQILLYLG